MEFKPVQVPEMGAHLILEFTNVKAFDLNNYEVLNEFLTKVITSCGATVESSQYKLFEPQGLTILYLLSESHFSIHTWPEHGSCAIDFYHCGKEAPKRLRNAETQLCNAFGWANCSTSMLVDRGTTSRYLLNPYEDFSTLYSGFNFVHQEFSKFQDIRVYDTKEMGRIMVLDGMIQITKDLVDNYTVDLSRKVVENKEKVYDHVLLIGAGDLIIPLYLLSNYPNIKKMTVCEIDERVVEVVRAHFGFSVDINKFIDEGRLKLVYDDGANFVKEGVAKGEKYDGIIIDNTDVFLDTGPAKSLFTPEFFKGVFDLLNSGSSFSQQVSCERIKNLWEKLILDAGFNEVSFIFSETPEYSTKLPLGIAKRL
jgi:spermidine synthase